MAPSSSDCCRPRTLLSSTANAAAAEDSASASASASLITARADEPNLYNIPSELRTTYQPLPTPVRLATVLLSMLISAVTTWRKSLSSLWLRPLLATFHDANWKKVLSFAAKTLLITVATNTVLQDILLPPSRVSMQALVNQYTLPSKLSRYEKMTLDSQGTQLGVHFLECHSSTPKEAKLDAIYLNHGFGASSLSWLPVVPPLVDRLQARVALGHDTAGFGFTDRPDDLEGYTSYTSAKIGLAVLQSRLSQDQDEQKYVLLMGHSMGSLATLRMALDLPQHVKQRIILVAPALGLFPRNSTPETDSVKKTPPSTAKKWRSRLTTVPKRLLLEMPVSYALRRAVGTPGFWREGLKLFWGDPKILSDSDVLRFQWPCVGKGWEQGILSFAQAQLLPSRSDQELLQQVLDRGIQVDVVVGAKDIVVRPSTIRKFLEPFPTVRIIEMEGLGHDSFEEDVDGFMSVVENLLAT